MFWEKYARKFISRYRICKQTQSSLNSQSPKKSEKKNWKNVDFFAFVLSDHFAIVGSIFHWRYFSESQDLNFSREFKRSVFISWYFFPSHSEKTSIWRYFSWNEWCNFYVFLFIQFDERFFCVIDGVILTFFFKLTDFSFV